MDEQMNYITCIEYQLYDWINNWVIYDHIISYCMYYPKTDDVCHKYFSHLQWTTGHISIQHWFVCHMATASCVSLPLLRLPFVHLDANFLENTLNIDERTILHDTE